MEVAVRPAAVTVRQPSPQASCAWLVSPPFDACFLANLWWPLVVGLGWWLADTESWFGFWQVYFLTTPHRWLTLALVTLDPDRRQQKTGWLVGIAVLATLLVGGVWLASGSLLCLALVDYLWNAWHFGAQHGGISRMYARRAGEASSGWQTWSLRLLVCYTSLRLAGWSTGWLETSPLGAISLLSVDMVVGAVCAGLLGAAAFRSSSLAGGRWLYVISVCALYAGMLAAVNLRATSLLVALVAASAAFHAVEYMAIVTFYARRRQRQGSPGLFKTMAGKWTLLLVVYVLCLGSLAFASDRAFRELWFAVNLWAAFLHYAYDGLIWKLRETGTARVLDVQLPASAGAKA